MSFRKSDMIEAMERAMRKVREHGPTDGRFRPSADEDDFPDFPAFFGVGSANGLNEEDRPKTHVDKCKSVSRAALRAYSKARVPEKEPIGFAIPRK